MSFQPLLNGHSPVHCRTWKHPWLGPGLVKEAGNLADTPTCQFWIFGCCHCTHRQYKLSGSTYQKFVEGHWSEGHGTLKVRKGQMDHWGPRLQYSNRHLGRVQPMSILISSKKYMVSFCFILFILISLLYCDFIYLFALIFCSLFSKEFCIHL
jgi:hypothetical protein